MKWIEGYRKAQKSTKQLKKRNEIIQEGKESIEINNNNFIPSTRVADIMLLTPLSPNQKELTIALNLFYPIVDFSASAKSFMDHINYSNTTKDFRIHLLVRNYTSDFDQVSIIIQDERFCSLIKSVALDKDVIYHHPTKSISLELAAINISSTYPFETLIKSFGNYYPRDDLFDIKIPLN